MGLFLAPSKGRVDATERSGGVDEEFIRSSHPTPNQRTIGVVLIDWKP
jgi:hypothetical protein